jgi:hypothetical protein
MHYVSESWTHADAARDVKEPGAEMYRAWVWNYTLKQSYRETHARDDAPCVE